MPRYMLILHDAMPVLAQMSPADMQAIIERYTAWGQKLGAAGQMVGGEKLKDEGGKRLTKSQGAMVVRDGPYAEAKEVIGGFYMIAAANYDDAVALCRDCPHLDLGGQIELREVDEMN